MRYMANLALLKHLFTKYKGFYKAHHGEDQAHMIKENNQSKGS